MNLTENEKRMVYQVESTCQAAILNEIAMNKRYAPNPDVRDCGRKVGPLQGGKHMYSYEERLRAVKLYIKYDHSLSVVIRELGYPSHQALLQWYREYITRGDLHAKCVRRRRRCKYTMEQRRAAVAYYQEHGQNLARTVKKLGYPSRATLFNWLKEDIGRLHKSE